MADSLQYFFRQKVSEAELNLGFQLLEQADRNLVADLGVHGVISGAVPTEHAPVADLTIDLTAPARAYDAAGQRVAFGTGQRVDCSVDSTGIPTEVTSANQERWLGVFLAFDRLLSDPRTDGNSQQIFFRHDESFRLIVRQGPVAPAGTASKVPLDDSAILLCDVKRGTGQTQIRNADLDLSRRQAFLFVRATATSVAADAWSLLSPAAPNVQSALDEVDEVLSDHIAGTATRHSAAAIDSTAHGFVTSTTVQAALNELIDKLSAVAAGGSGAQRIGADAVPGTPAALGPGHVRAQLAQLLGFLNTHLATMSGAHPASAVVVTDAANLLDAGTVESAIQELANSHGLAHFRGNETNTGQHKTIRQPALAEASTKALLWESLGVGQPLMKLRVYADADSVWFVANVLWNGTAWARQESGSPAGGFRFARHEFEIFHDATTQASWVTWERAWKLNLGDSLASAFEVRGPIQDQGRAGVAATNTASATKLVTMESTVTFRCRFAQPPSSITLAPLTVDHLFVGTPIVVDVTKDGFVLRSFQNIPAETPTFWHGTYTTA